MHHHRHLLFAAAAALALPAFASAQFTLTLLHNNDGESDVLPNASNAALNPGAGDAARFATLVNERRAASTSDGLLTLTSGDNFLPGKEFNASLSDFPGGTDFYDARVIRNVGYDALTLGNHDFDFGPELLANFIRASQPTGGRIPFLSANLDFTAEPSLQALFDDGLIARSATFTFGTERVAVVGGTTPELPFISSPGRVRVLDPLASIQGEVNRLGGLGVNKIILSSHLQSVQEDLRLLENLRGVDVAIAGGGDDLLDPYPLLARDADNRIVPVVTAPGNYEYLGELNVAFDASGNVTGFNGQTFLNDNSREPDAVVSAQVLSPVAANVAALDANIIATSSVAIDERSGSVRSRETNSGNLVADSQLDAARRLASDFGVSLDNPLVSLANGGGIRGNRLFPAGDYSEGRTFDTLPFGNFVAVIEDVTVETLKLTLENAVSRISLNAAGDPFASGAGTGRFAQVGGFRFIYDPAEAALTFNSDGTQILEAGSRIVRLELDDGTILIDGGVIVLPGFLVDVVTNNFNARGGDQFPLRGDLLDPFLNRAGDFTLLGTTGQQALAFYIQNVLNGVIGSDLYSEGGSGRISLVPEPASVLVAAAACGLLLRRRRA